MISKEEILMGRDKEYPKEYTKEVSDNIDKLLISLNKFRKAYGKPMSVSSGWRPAAINSKIANAAKKSNHMVGLACDFKDADGSLDAFCMANLKLLEECGLYLEHPDATVGWCHLQCISPKSGNRVFRP
jgi:uncharacterized protein YcbK (DUF882 family)